MDVSVIVPAYNTSRDVACCLNGLRSSTPPPLEVIVVDDASTDDTAAVAESMGPEPSGWR